MAADSAEAPPVTAPPDSSAVQSGQPPADAKSAVPASPPEAKAEFNPEFSPPVTHDLRTSRPEEDNAHLLVPLDAKNPSAKPPTVTILQSEYNALQTAKDFEVVTVDFSKTEATLETAEQLVRVFAGVSGPAVSPSAAPKAPDGTAPATDGQKPSDATPPPSDDVPVATERMSAGKKLTILATIGVVLLTTFFLGKTLEFRKWAKAAAAQPNQTQPTEPKVARSIYIAMDASGIAIRQAVDYAQQKIVWVTSNPMVDTTWQTLAAAANDRNRAISIKVLVVSNTASVQDLEYYARQYGLSTYIAPISSVTVNWLIIDDSSFLNVASDVSADFSLQKSDAKHAMDLIAAKFFPYTRAVYQAPARQLPARR